MSFFRSSFIKLPKHKTFEYKPRYFDPEKEEREKRQKPGGGFEKGSMARQWRAKRQSRNASAGRTFILMALLALVAYLILG